MVEDKKEYHRRKAKEYYHKNKAKCRARHKKWIENNPSKYREGLDKQNAKPKNKYAVQKYDAQRRDIEWLFTFETWWKVWQDSGKWEQRGTHAHEYCMCRYGDTGPYSPDNVYIETNSQNTIDQLRRLYGDVD